jgi:hypothetical protein
MCYEVGMIAIRQKKSLKGLLKEVFFNEKQLTNIGPG